MATITATKLASAEQTAPSDMRFRRVAWEGFTTSGDVGSAIQMGSWADRSVQVIGSFGTGGTLVIEGSNDGGTNFTTLTDPQGNALSFTAAGLEAITELVGHIRPRLSAGTGSIDVDVYMFLGGNKD